MIYAVAFFTELFILFLLSKQLTKKLSLFLHMLTRSKKLTIYYMAALFFPGTFVHEMSHYIMALLLNVPVGRMEFLPEVQEHGVKLGSVSIAHTDPFRRLFIGMAPFLFGTTLILALLYAGSFYELFNTYWFILLTGYVVFEIGNTMFSSRKDMEGALELLLGLFAFTLVLYFAGLRLPAFDPNVIFGQPIIAKVFEKGSYFLLAPLAIDAVALILLGFFIKKKSL